MTSAPDVILDGAPCVPPVCAFCEHYQGHEGRHCAAFPTSEIPVAIYVGDNPHREPYPGDGGIRFKALAT